LRNALAAVDAEPVIPLVSGLANTMQALSLPAQSRDAKKPGYKSRVFCAP